MTDFETTHMPSWATVDLGHGMTHSRFARHVRVSQPSHSIKGKYIIGTSAPDHYPPLFDMPQETVTSQSASSASFESSSSAIGVEVWIMGDDTKAEEKLGQDTTVRLQGPEGEAPSKTKPVSVNAKSTLGRVHVAVPRYTSSRPLAVRAKSTNGAVHVQLPPQFSGLVSWRTERGELRLSPKMRERYVSLGESYKHRGVGMIVRMGQNLPSGQTVGQAKAVAEKKGLKAKGAGGKKGSRPTTPDAAAVPAGEEKELGLPAAAAATAASVSGQATRGDAVELISTYGNIHIYEAGESLALSLQENCVVQ